jgi:hypothetical protein|tara:strand:- start:981 stop:1436 length:456 start_codon:yes stop_codon:yes gene_type:complete
VLILCSFLYSCASVSPENNLFNTYNGKILIKTINNESTSYNANIIIYENRSIIQIKKPFIGNVMNINIYSGSLPVADPRINNTEFAEIISTNGQYTHDILFDCIKKGSIDKKILKEVNLNIVCRKDKSNTIMMMSFERNEIKILIKGKGIE